MTPLRQRMINDMTVRGLASSTIESYLRSVTRLARHYRRSPDQISADEVQAYLLFLHENHGLSWATCNTVRHGVRFFFRITLGRPDPHFYVPGAKVPTTLPQVLNHDELVRLFTVTTNRKHRAVLMTAYAAGLRASDLYRNAHTGDKKTPYTFNAWKNEIWQLDSSGNISRTMPLVVVA